MSLGIKKSSGHTDKVLFGIHNQNRQTKNFKLQWIWLFSHKNCKFYTITSYQFKVFVNKGRLSSLKEAYYSQIIVNITLLLNIPQGYHLFFQVTVYTEKENNRFYFREYSTVAMVDYNLHIPS